MGIGLTEFIQIPEIRQELDSEYPNPGEPASSELKVPNNGYSHRMVGNAFEFICRLHIYNQSETLIKPEITAPRWGDPKEIYPPEEFPEIRLYLSGVPDEAVKTIEEQAEKYVETGLNTDYAVKAALAQTGWEEVDNHQAGLNLDAFEEELVDELQELFGLLREQEWPAGSVAYDTPRFGEVPYILLGEGDFIVDDILVDIKTTENSHFQSSYWRQLFSYYLLTDIQRVLYEETERSVGEKYPEIQEVGIYFARRGDLETVSIDEVVSDEKAYNRFRAWFVDKAIEKNHDERYNYDSIRAALTDPYDFKRQGTLFDDYSE